MYPYIYIFIFLYPSEQVCDDGVKEKLFETTRGRNLKRNEKKKDSALQKEHCMPVYHLLKITWSSQRTIGKLLWVDETKTEHFISK